LCVGHDTVGAPSANVGAVKLGGATSAAVDNIVGNLAEDARDGAGGAAGRRLEVLLELGAGGGCRLRLLGVALGDVQGGVDDALLRATAVALDHDALGLLGRVVLAVNPGGLRTVDVDLDGV